MPYTPVPGILGVTPADPSAATSASYVMAGLGVAGANAWAMTPQVTGRILLVATGIQTSGTTASTCTVQMSQGTGAAPANGAAVTGTQVGGQPAWTSLTGILTVPFSLVWVTTGNAIGTALWFDIAQKSSGGTLQLSKLNLVAIEF